jgi:hypothetical protein
MSCQSCGDICVVYHIRSPAELRKAVAVVADNLRDGIIRHRPELELQGSRTFAALVAGAPPNDLVTYEFECCHCHQEFRLTAETYHGTGGPQHCPLTCV